MAVRPIRRQWTQQPQEAVRLAAQYAIPGALAYVASERSTFGAIYTESGTITRSVGGSGYVTRSGTTSSYVSVGQVQQALVGASWVFQFTPLDTSQRWLSGTVDTGFNYFEDIIVNSNSDASGVSAGRLAFGMRRDGGVNASRVGNTTNVCLTVGAVHTAVVRLISTSAFEIWVDGVNQPITYGTTNPIGDTAGLTEWPLVLLNRNLRNAFTNGTGVDLSLYARIPAPVDAAELSTNPWGLFEPKRIWVPVAAASGNGTATGATLTATASLIDGAASGVRSPTASGQTLTATASLIDGTASAGASGTANGVVLSTSASLIDGAASAVRSPTVAGVLLSTLCSFIAGNAYVPGVGGGGRPRTGINLRIGIGL